MLLAIDPGYTQSAWVEYDNGRPVAFGLDPNWMVLHTIAGTKADRCAIESIASYGMAVGAEVFETAVWSGRFIQRWADRADPFNDTPVLRVYRREVKLHLCGQASAKDSNVRQALIDRYGPTKAVAVGFKAHPGPLYGFKADLWAALGVAVTVSDRGPA